YAVAAMLEAVAPPGPRDGARGPDPRAARCEVDRGIRDLRNAGVVRERGAREEREARRVGARVARLEAVHLVADDARDAVAVLEARTGVDPVGAVRQDEIGVPAVHHRDALAATNG